MQWKLSTGCAKQQPCLARWRVDQHAGSRTLHQASGIRRWAEHRWSSLLFIQVCHCATADGIMAGTCVPVRGPWQDRTPRSLRSGRAYCFITTLLQKLTGLPWEFYLFFQRSKALLMTSYTLPRPHLLKIHIVLLHTGDQGSNTLKLHMSHSTRSW